MEASAALAPSRSLTQRMDALRRANDVRTARADLKRKVKAKRDPAPIVAQLVEPGDRFETMKVFDALLAMPKVGRVKANKILAAARVSPSKTIGGLSDRQRREVLALLGRGR